MAIMIPWWPFSISLELFWCKVSLDFDMALRDSYADGRRHVGGYNLMGGNKL